MLSPEDGWNGLTETLHFQKMRSWDDCSWYLLKPQAEAFFNSDGCIKRTCSGGVGFMLFHLHLSAGGGEAEPCLHCLHCLPAPPPLLGARWSLRQAHTITLIKEQLSSMHLHTQALTYSFLLGKALVAVQVLECCVTDLFAYSPHWRRQAKRHSSAEHDPCCLEGDLISFSSVPSSSFSH